MTLQDHLARALNDARLENARGINRVRVAGSGAFLLALAVTTGGVNQEGISPIMPPTLVYFGLALVVLVGSRYSDRILGLSRFAIPIFDMPAVFAIQWINVGTNPNPGHVSEFSVALFLCLIMLSAYTLSVRHVFLSMTMAILFEQLLQDRAGIEWGGRLFSPIVFGLATWICVWAGRNRLRLVETVTLADARRQRLQRYFSPGVGELLEQREDDRLGEGKDCELTILFVDIRGFTSLSERLTSREVVEILNIYHAHMVEVVFRHGGTLDKYLGDGLIAYFNAPVGQPDHAIRAVSCALDMRKELREVNAWLEERGRDPIGIGIGVHTGSAVVGDIGAPHRREFTAIGSAVNIASRLEGMTKEVGRPIVVSEETAKLVDSVSWEELGAHEIRGCREPLPLLSPKGRE